MAITLFYRCTCGLSTGMLDEAQEHANETGHNVVVSGSLTSNQPVLSEQKIAEAAEKRVREAAILRAARDRGLIARRS